MPTLEELSACINGELKGDSGREISAVSTLENAGPSDISFLSNPRYRDKLASTKAGAVILVQDDVTLCPTSSIIVDDPYLAFARISTLLLKPGTAKTGISSSAVVSTNCNIGDDSYIGPHAVIEDGVMLGTGVTIGAGSYVGENSVIGDGTSIGANVTICYNSEIGKNVMVHPGVVIGADGFGLANDNGVWIKIPQTGRVVIGDDVEIGANTTIDRGALEDTVLEQGVKLDNQIQVAHNVHIGAHTAIAGCTAIAGSTHIGKYCTIAGAVGIVGHLDITDHVHVTAMSLVTHSITKPGSYSGGTGLEETVQWRKNAVRFRQLDDMARRVAELKKKFNHTDE